MKKIFLLFIAVIFITLVACEESETNVKETEKEKEIVEAVEDEELTRQDEIKNLIKQKVDKDYNRTVINNIRVNDHAGLGEGFIVLVDLSFEAKNRANTAKDMIEMYSSDLAATLAGEADIHEVVSFWQVPYLKTDTNIAKIVTERSGDSMVFIEQWYDHNIFD